MSDPLVYVAGPLFDEGERWFIERVDEVVSGAGFRTFLPHRDNVSKTADSVVQIFETNVAQIEAADLVVASLNGVITDDGTAWELGYARARGTYSIGVHTDWRMRFEGEVVNLMIEQSLDELVRSLNDLTASLARWRQR